MYKLLVNRLLSALVAGKLYASKQSETRVAFRREDLAKSAKATCAPLTGNKPAVRGLKTSDDYAYRVHLQ
jgi:hypothetical protein